MLYKLNNFVFLFIRYGLQLCSKVKISNEDTKPSSMKELQLTQNRLLRMLNNTRIKDKVSTASMLEKFDLLSVNQLAASIKLQEVWKSLHVDGNPISLEPYNPHQNLKHELRYRSNRIFNDSHKLKITESSFNTDAARIWNTAPDEIRCATTLAAAKKEIKKYAKSLPI